MGQIIIAMSGRKGAGKNEIAKYISHWFQTKYDINVFECSFADEIKEFCVNVLGLERKQCYGTQEDKLTLTPYMWDNTPSFTQWKFGSREVRLNGGASVKCIHGSDAQMQAFYYDCTNGFKGLPMGMRTGPMNARDIMQIFGTDCVRTMFGNVWAKATVCRIKRTPVSVITDNRFPNEVDEILKEKKGFVIRLTRSPSPDKDMHESETALDTYPFMDTPKCFVVDNANMTIEEQNTAVTPILERIVESI